MGGNALKHLAPVRLTSAEVTDLAHHLHRNWQLVDDRPLYVVPWVSEKADHGDIDLICEAPPETVVRFCALVQADPAAIHRNGNVLSVPVPLPWMTTTGERRICQVDFICCSAEDACATRFFYAGGDFGMLLGRVAAWQGLVFGMDGLRYRADRECPWQSDVHLTANPAVILNVLGYPPALPWFDTYDRLWCFVLSSPLAGPWMFMPEATNHENRSRDRQRRKVGDFQDWLVANYPGGMEPPAPRRTPSEAREWVRTTFPLVDIDTVLSLQEARFNHAKLLTYLLGIGAVEAVIGPGHDRELLGSLVHAMQDLLPAKPARDAMMSDPERWSEMIRLARDAAASVAISRGLAIRDGAPIPAFVPSP